MGNLEVGTDSETAHSLALESGLLSPSAFSISVMESGGAAAILYEPWDVGLFPAVDACFNAALCAALYVSVTANANGWSDVEANAQLNAEPNAELNAEVMAKFNLIDLNRTPNIEEILVESSA